ncbi:MAG: DNA primase [Desulfobacca sp.]|uniref:DNA primase n=1 Tax=Desulfobacca sp. TaxID=2067990 RepID=UPI00404B6348
MAPLISEAKILEIKDVASIADVIGQYVRLTPRGRYLVGLCPFHAEKTPSFTVYPERQIFHCFGCGAGGNVFSFLMQHLRLTFPEAVAELAQRYGIALNWQKDLGPGPARLTRQRQGWFTVNELAAAFFAQTLAHPQQGRIARDYLAQRGLPTAVAQAYRLGYAPDDWRLLVRTLSERGADLQAALELGLIIQHHAGGHYDRFRGRLIFPIFDLQGRVIAFGGRIIGPGEPKYLNSPESGLYTKGRQLYGLYQAKDAIRQQNLAIIVEGYMDLLALRARGIEPVVATLGTALTREQLRLLKGYTSRVVLVFDADAAGLKAMQRSLPLFSGERLPARVLTLPAGEDPDSYAAKYGVAVFQDPWEQAQPLFEFLLDQALAGAADSLEGKLSAFYTLKPYLQDDVDPVEKNLWLQLAAKRLGVPQSVLAASCQAARPTPLLTRPAQDDSLDLEKRFIQLLLTYPEVLAKFDLAAYLDHFRNPQMQTIARCIHACYQQVGYLDHSLLVMQIDEEDICRRICSLALAAENYRLENLDAELADYTRSFEKIRLKRDYQHLRQQMEQAYKNGKGGEVLALQAELQHLRQKLKELSSTP